MARWAVIRRLGVQIIRAAAGEIVGDYRIACHYALNTGRSTDADQ
jgi:hypothetical protein